MGRRKKFQPQSWQRWGCDSKFVSLYSSLLQSPAFKSLTHRQKTLYLYMALQYRGAGKEFEFNWAKANKVYELYTNRQSFYDDIAKLITTGFIVCVQCGKNTRTNSRYAFSDNWQLFPKIELSCKDMTSSMIKKQKMAVSKM